MTDTSKKKTLTLQRKPAQHQEDAGKPRRRSGARARHVAQQEITKQKYATPAPVVPQEKEKAPSRKHERKPFVKQAQVYQVFVPCPGFRVG